MTIVPEQDLSIMGDRVLAGGRYRRIRVMGDLRMEGDVRCISLDCLGKAVVTGSFQSQKVAVMGDMEFLGPVDAGEFGIMGDVACRAGIRAREIHALGDLKVAGTINADRIRIKGEITVDGDCDADVFDSRGAFQVGGRLSVDALTMVVWGPCQASAVGGSSIVVRRRGGFLGAARLWDGLLAGLRIRERKGRLEARSIEGDVIHLEDTTADLVRGRAISIGRGCRIGRVEYTGSFSCAKDASIESVVAP